MTLIDTHAHVDEVEDLSVALHEASDAGVAAVIGVGMDYDSNQRVLEIAGRYPMVRAAIGLHPWQLSRMQDVEEGRVLRQIEDNANSVVAIGEVGLDYDRRVRVGASKERQQAVLREVLALARRHERPVSVHSRYAWADAVRLVQESMVKRAAFHWYTGPSSVLRELLASGYHVSITPAAEYHAEHRRAAREASVGSLMFETDAPVAYGLGSKWTSSPKDVQRSLKAVAEIRQVDAAALAEQTTANARRFFGI